MKYFGTDGIRGEIDNGLDSKLAYRVGYAVGRYINDNFYTKKVIIGTDTRISNHLIANAVSCGIMDAGIDCYMLGVVPTACVSYLAKTMDVGFAIMITASHNSWEMNGIKIINRFGLKCSQEEEKTIEQYIDEDNRTLTINKGCVFGAEKYVDNYVNSIINSINLDLTGIDIALDTANGSNYYIAPVLFKKLGANVVCIANHSDGHNINRNCGAQYIEQLRQEVLDHGCDYGFAFDGDADRLRVVLSDGKVLDGDDILYILAKYMQSNNQLNRSTIVGTIMTNRGIEASLRDEGIGLVRVDVGDKNVINKMRSENYNLGGEPSGHIALSDYNTTCDALFNALYLLKAIIVSKLDIRDYLNLMTKYPVIEKNIAISSDCRAKFDNQTFVAKLQKKIRKLENDCYIIVRPSGTEPVIRLSVESRDVAIAQQCMAKLTKIINNINKA